MTKLPRLCLAWLAAVAAISITGCSRQEGPGKPAAQAPADPLSSFKVIAEKCSAAIVSSDTTLPGKDRGFVRKIITVHSKSYDVRKTDSLVSPYAGFVDLRYFEKAGAADRKDELSDDAKLLVGIEHSWRLVYAFQDGAWVLKDELHSFVMPGAGIEAGPMKSNSIGTLAAQLASANACKA